MRPVSDVVPKALLPLVDADERLRPVVHFICAEAAAAGIQQVALVVMGEQEPMLRAYFEAARRAGDSDLPGEVRYVLAEPKGFGYAVLQAQEFVGDEPMLVMLGDHVHLAAR